MQLDSVLTDIDEVRLGLETTVEKANKLIVSTEQAIIERVRGVEQSSKTERLEKRLDDLETREQEVRRSIRRLDEEKADADKAVADIARNKNEIESQLKEEQGRLREIKVSIAGKEGEERRLEKRLRELKGKADELEGLEERHAQSTRESTSADARLQELNLEVGQTQLACDDLVQSFNARTQDLQQLELKIQQLERNKREKNADIKKLDTEIQQKTLKALEDETQVQMRPSSRHTRASSASASALVITRSRRGSEVALSRRGSDATVSRRGSDAATSTTPDIADLRLPSKRRRVASPAGSDVDVEEIFGENLEEEDDVEEGDEDLGQGWGEYELTKKTGRGQTTVKLLVKRPARVLDFTKGTATDDRNTNEEVF